MHIIHKPMQLVFVVLAIGLSSNAFADVNISAQHSIVSSTNISGGSETVVTINLNNIGSENLHTLEISSADTNLTLDTSLPLLEIAQLDAGAQLSVQMTLNTRVDSSYFIDGLLLMNLRAYNDQGLIVTTSFASEQGVQ